MSTLLIDQPGELLFASVVDTAGVVRGAVGLWLRVQRAGRMCISYDGSPGLPGGEHPWLQIAALECGALPERAGAERLMKAPYTRPLYTTVYIYEVWLIYD